VGAIDALTYATWVSIVNWAWLGHMTGPSTCDKDQSCRLQLTQGSL